MTSRNDSAAGLWGSEQLGAGTPDGAAEGVDKRSSPTLGPRTPRAGEVYRRRGGDIRSGCSCWPRCFCCSCCGPGGPVYNYVEWDVRSCSNAWDSSWAWDRLNVPCGDIRECHRSGVAFWGRRPGQVIPRPDWSTTFLPRYDRPFFVRVHRVQCFEESRIGSAACSQGTKSVRSASVASGILRLSPIDRFACRISRADDVPNFTPPGVSKCPNKVGSCAGHKPGLLGDFSRRLAEHHNHRGAIPHWLVGSGSSDSNKDTASSIRADGTDQRHGRSEPLGNSLSMRRTTAVSTVSLGVDGKSNHDSMGDTSVRVSKNRNQDTRASLDETRPREWAPPLAIGSPLYATADSITSTVWLHVLPNAPMGRVKQDLDIATGSRSGHLRHRACETPPSKSPLVPWASASGDCAQRTVRDTSAV